ncbi:MAG: hypothetical protein M1837_007080 [Sclerophora amabilis]|nr:MAG: hypothetical protein M1837_007080 [Sclerophora amabilis]
MAPLDTQQMFWKLRIDTSAANPSVPQTAQSPAREHGDRSIDRSSQSSGWHQPWIYPEPSSSNRRAENPFVPVNNSFTGDDPDAASSRSFVLSPSGTNHAQGERSHQDADAPALDGAEPLIPLLDSASVGRQSSISFNPKVTTDSGREKGLGQPLSKPDRWAPQPRPRGRSLLQELTNAQHNHSPPNKSRISLERPRYNASTGELRSRPVRFENPAPAHGPVLHSSIEGPTRNPGPEEREFVSSLTSESTSSPVVDEALTPPETPVEFTLSPLSATSPFHRSTSLNNTNAWPTPQPRGLSQRSKSYNIDRSRGSLRSGRTPSHCSPSSFSPASAFLSSWGVTSPALSSEPDDEGQEVGNYVLGKQVGFGAFSIVREARTIEDGGEVRRAVKIVRKHIAGKEDRENEQVQSEFEHEVTLWRFLSHPHILPLIAVYNTPFATFAFTQLHDRGSLFDLVRHNRKGLAPALSKRYSFQLASALRYLHEDAHIVHRDVKLENCLLDMSDPDSAITGGKLLLCDFGMAEFTNCGNEEDDEDDSSSRSDHSLYEEITDRPPPKAIGPSDTSTSVVGSLEYASPELLQSEVPLYSKAGDIWAFGVVVFAMLIGDLPFQHTFQPKVRKMIVEGDWDREALRSVQIDAAGQHAADLVRGCLNMDPIVRWSVGQVLHSMWLEDCNEAYDMDISGGWKL